MIPPPPRPVLSVSLLYPIPIYTIRMLLTLLLLPFLAITKATTYTLNHRYSSQREFTQYGTIDLPGDRDVNEVIRIDKTSSDVGTVPGDGKGWYTVQLVGEGLGAGVVSSTKAVCPCLCLFTFILPQLTSH